MTGAAGQLDQELTLLNTRSHATSGVIGLSLLTTDLASCQVLLEVTSRPHGVHMDEAKVCEGCEARVSAD